MEIIYKKKMEKQKHVEAEQHANKQPCIIKEIKEEIRKYLNNNENTNSGSKSLGCMERGLKRDPIAIHPYIKEQQASLTI